jgi:hypothetical protein
MALSTYLLPIADREPLGWILREQRTAFAEHRARDAAALNRGDVLLLYTTRGCFRNPRRDRGRVVGRAIITRLAKRVRSPPEFGGREYPYVVELSIESLVPVREGIELAPLVSQLGNTFPDRAIWAVRMRRALVPVHPRDAALIERELKTVARPYEESISSYRVIK